MPFYCVKATDYSLIFSNVLYLLNITAAETFRERNVVPRICMPLSTF